MRSIIFILGWIFVILAVLMLVPIGTAVLYHEFVGRYYAAVALGVALLGFILIQTRPKSLLFRAKEGLACTSLAWIFMSLFGALPLYLSREIPAYIDAVFEIVSGFTTTGASILASVEDMSRTANIWRCFTHWIGGMGVLVFLLAVLPMVGGSNMQLMKAESPGPSVGKLVPKVRFTARLLYLLYVALTFIMVFFLLMGRMSLYDSLCTAFGTAGTGGFGIYNTSCGGFSPYLQWVITIFMILFGVNFNVYYLLFLRKVKDAVKCEEMHWYLGIIVFAALFIYANTSHLFGSLEEGLRTCFFQVSSIITTTGFSTADFDLWPSFSKTILVTLMFVGACAGSTGGGTKVSRVVIAGKCFSSYVGKYLHPRAVDHIQFEYKNVEDKTIQAIFLYYVGVVTIVAGSILLVSLDGFDLVTNFTAVAATFNNIGPGLSAVGPTANFAGFSVLSKLILIFDMLAGRLEVFPMLLLLHPLFWRELVSEVRTRSLRSRRQFTT